MAPVIVDTLWTASLQGGVLALAVWALCRVVPSLPASARAALWWMVGLKLIVGLAWTDPVSIPVLRAPEVPSVAAAAAPGPEPGATAAAMTAAATPRQRTATREPRDVGNSVIQRSSGWTWQWFAAGLWALGTAIVLSAMAWRFRTLSRVVAQAAPAPGGFDRVAALMSRRLAIAPPRILVSDDVASPMVRGVRRPVVVLPAQAFEALDPEAQRMVLCHELVHVRRRDLWLGWIPELAAHVFFFHPLAHLAVREYRLAREAACDAEVLQTLGAEPRDYGRLLLTLGVVRREPVLAAAGASRSFSDMKRRLQMLNHFDPSPRMRRAGRIVLGCAAVALIPIQLVARHPVAPVAPRVGDLSLAGPVAMAIPDPTGMIAEPAPTEPVERVQQAPARQRDPGFEWAIVKKDGDVSGTHDDHSRVRRFQRNGEPLLWVRVDGQEYVIRDPQLVREAEASFDEVEAIGKQMGEIGGRQGALGAMQAEVGAKQAALGAREAELGAKMGELAQKQVALAMEKVSRAMQRAAARRDVRATTADERALDEQMDSLGDQMKSLGSQLEELVKPLEEFGRQMEPLASQLSAMGKQIETKVAEAEAQVRALAQRAIASGKAALVK